MEYRALGRSGLMVSSYALGTMTFGAETPADVAHDQLDAFLEAGGNLVDTADVYAAGASEEIVGGWLRSRPAAHRDRVVLATKARFPVGPSRGDGADPNRGGLSRRYLARALEASLRRLGVDHVDLYQVHAWDPLTPAEEWLRFLDDAVGRGLVGYVGLSNLTGWQTQKVVDLADRYSWARPISMQPQYNLLAREIEYEVVPACLSEGLGLLPWSPLGGGWLTGKYSASQRPTGATRLGEDPERGVEAYDRRAAAPRTWEVLQVLDVVARQRGISPAAAALAWVHDRPGVASVILGARTLEQLTANLAAVGVRLDEVETAALDEVSDPGPGDYPYGEPGRQQRHRRV